MYEFSLVSDTYKQLAKRDDILLFSIISWTPCKDNHTTEAIKSMMNYQPPTNYNLWFPPYLSVLSLLYTQMIYNMKCLPDPMPLDMYNLGFQMPLHHNFASHRVVCLYNCYFMLKGKLWERWKLSWVIPKWLIIF